MNTERSACLLWSTHRFNLLHGFQKHGHARKDKSDRGTQTLPHLTLLALDGNHIGDTGLRAFAEAIALGALDKLQKLNLNRNRVSDLGIKSLFEACADDALPELKELRMYENKITDEGVVALAELVDNVMECPFVTDKSSGGSKYKGK